MAYFAELNNNTVVRVISISNDICGEPTLSFPETESAGRAFIANTLKLEGTWKQTSFNNNFRGIFASIGYTYDADLDIFIAPQPFPSWTLVEETCQWSAPTPMPVSGMHRWDEATLSWVEISA